MDFEWTADEQRLRQELKDFVGEVVRPGWTLYDRDMPGTDERDAVLGYCLELAKRRLLTPHWPPEYGGRDASAWEQVVVSEELWGAGEPRGPQYMNITWIGPAIMKAGTEEQKARYLPPISRGEAMWCQGFSEPGAGTDLAALQTSAYRDGDEYVINGQKIWTSYAHFADYCFLLVRTAPGRHGITILLVPMDTPGIEVREIPTMGFHHIVHEMFFTDVRVPADCRLGPENEGWNLIRTILANERVGLARHEHADRALDNLVAELEADGGTLDDPDVLEALGNAAADTAATRVLNYVAVDHRHRDSPEQAQAASVYRASMAQMEHGITHTYYDVLGTQALSGDSLGDYSLMFSTTSTIASGTLEVQLNNVARHVLGLPKG
ncbi:MAG TPA: acyl-CoA dehydrogenase family protein [Amycolatopsis sp.]|nr:acyl-CoA dehydrogenase family protein [Amycolatopsis sp.]